jgi:hypothetical protein
MQRLGNKWSYFARETETSIVETFLVLPSWDCIVSEPIFMGPIL